MSEILAVGIGGFIGANIRYGLTRLFPVVTFPAATLLANVIAGFAIGFVIGFDGVLYTLTPRWKYFINTGILGGLSTFSTFSLETVKLFQSGKIAVAGANVALNLALSILGVVIGMVGAKLLSK